MDSKNAWKSHIYRMLKYGHFEYIPVQVYLIQNKINIFQAILYTVLPHYAADLSIF